jgi:drug/metabolite transporter (DMT)-like permease
MSEERARILLIMLAAVVALAADLSFALPLTAASYPLAAVLARFYLREDVGTARWLGTLVITAGVAIVALGDSAANH